jgi:hypothetical protein
MLYIYKISNINDLLYNYLRREIIYYMSKKFKINFQSYIGLIYGIDHFFYNVNRYKKMEDQVL